MSKRFTTPTSRLICFGGAKAMTMASNFGDPEVDIGGPEELS